MADTKLDKLADIFFAIKDAPDIIKGRWAARRMIPLMGPIDETMITQVAMMMIQLDNDSNDPVTLLIHSCGGDSEYSFYLRNVIRALNSPVDGLVVGRASSMALDILQMCRKRQMLPDSRIYCHFTRLRFELISDTDQFGGDEVSAMRQKVLAFKKTREHLYADRTGKTVKEIQRLFRLGEVYNLDMSAEEALKQKLIDEIVTDFKFLSAAKAGQ